mgnify:FL=1
MITLYKEYSIGVKKLSDAELNRDDSPSGQTHIGLSEKVLTFLPKTPEQRDGILVVNQSCSFVECAFSKIGNKRSTKIDTQTTNPVKSVVKQIRNIASNANVGWYLVWFALENQTPVFWLLNDNSEDYKDLADIFENSQSLSVYTASKEEYFRLLMKIRSFKKLMSLIETKYDVSHENRLIAISKEHRTFVHLCMDYFRIMGQLDKMIPYFSTEDANVPITVKHDGVYKLQNMFMFADIDEIEKRNSSSKNGRRWYTDPFKIAGRDIYLYVDWFPGKDSHGKDTQLMIPDFVKFISECFGDKYVYRNAQGTHEMWEINDPENYNIIKVVDSEENNIESDTEEVSQTEETEPEKPLTFTSSHPRQIIYYGAPGTGKSHTIKKEEDEGKITCIRTTFHPDSDYATFVGCYKPHKIKNSDNLTYEFVEQAFLSAYKQAWMNPKEEIALVIEEINRGNCAQVFGDIFQLLDRDEDGWSTYPIKADTDIAEHLAESRIQAYAETMKDRFGKDKEGNEKYPDRNWFEFMALPPNMSILATMNTSDQSLFPIDSAFKRRWDWRYIPICQGKSNGEDGKQEGEFLDWTIETSAENNSWWDFLCAINGIIESTTHSEDKELGFFFCKANKEGVISAEKFVNKVVFYLWTDVFKTYGFRSDIFDKDADGKEKIAFKDFFNKETGEPNGETVKLFVENVMKHLPKEG